MSAGRNRRVASTTIGLVLDCHDPDQLAAFWADALGYQHVGSAADHALLVRDGQGGPKLVLQRVPEPKTGKNRMHLDVMTPDIEACAATRDDRRAPHSLRASYPAEPQMDRHA